MRDITILIIIYFGIQYYHASSVKKGGVPEIVRPMLDGNMFSSTQLQGKPYLIHFWATWCGICKLEKNTVNAIARDYRVVTIASRSSRRQVLEYMDKHHLSFPVVLDENGAIARKFGVSAYPTSIMVDAEGKIAFVEVGYTTEIGLRARLKWL